MSFFEAQFSGECQWVSCEEPIQVGQLIVSAANGGYVHVICPELVPEPAKAVCPGCFLELPASGVCGVCDE